MPKKNTYTDWTKDELIKRVTVLDKRKKHGLVWEEEKTKEKLDTDILIESDNYHALSVLNYTHANSIDVIYIDQPVQYWYNLLGQVIGMLRNNVTEE